MRHFKWLLTELTCAHGTNAESNGTKYWNEGKRQNAFVLENKKVGSDDRVNGLVHLRFRFA